MAAALGSAVSRGSRVTLSGAGHPRGRWEELRRGSAEVLLIVWEAVRGARRAGRKGRVLRGKRLGLRFSGAYSEGWELCSEQRHLWKLGLFRGGKTSDDSTARAGRSGVKEGRVLAEAALQLPSVPVEALSQWKAAADTWF